MHKLLKDAILIINQTQETFTIYYFVRRNGKVNSLREKYFTIYIYTVETVFLIFVQPNIVLVLKIQLTLILLKNV